MNNITTKKYEEVTKHLLEELSSPDGPASEMQDLLEPDWDDLLFNLLGLQDGNTLDVGHIVEIVLKALDIHVVDLKVIDGGKK